LSLQKKEYSESVLSWKELSGLTNIAPKHVELQISALSNLGYMLFFGYGIEENKEEAVVYWNKAIGLGHTEAEYHLCHAFADPEVSTYNPVKALSHCEKAKLIYQGMEKKNDDEKSILKQVKNYLKQLKK
jgi:TPR repeat protein